jgi:hypothetical protein
MFKKVLVKLKNLCNKSILSLLALNLPTVGWVRFYQKFIFVKYLCDQQQFIVSFLSKILNYIKLDIFVNYKNKHSLLMNF